MDCDKKLLRESLLEHRVCLENVLFEIRGNFSQSTLGHTYCDSVLCSVLQLTKRNVSMEEISLAESFMSLGLAGIPDNVPVGQERHPSVQE